jgi:lysylphosphatidylglycerol synthetase-like protein (DUF2156 family)
MSALFFWIWLAGGIPAVTLGEIMRAERPWVVRAARIAFALLLGADLLFAAVVFAVGSSNPDERLRATRSIWWLTITLGGIPLALVSGLAVRRGYTGHRLALSAATLITAVLYLSFPFGFTPADQPLNRLGRFGHEHHALAVAILLIPTLLLLTNELRWKREVGPDEHSLEYAPRA